MAPRRAAGTSPESGCSTLQPGLRHGRERAGSTRPRGAQLRWLARSSPITIIYDSSKGACSGHHRALWRFAAESQRRQVLVAQRDRGGCDLAITGQAASFGALQLEAQRCPDIPATLPADIGRFDGPVGSVNVFVHPQSSQTSISSEALYNVYGFGADSGVAPWTDPSVMIRRNANSAVQIIWALPREISAERFHATTIDAQTNPESVRLVAESRESPGSNRFRVEPGRGFRKQSSRVRTLAYQDKGQTCGYWPTRRSTASTRRTCAAARYALVVDAQVLRQGRFHGEDHGLDH